ncbi:hypothetical protein AGR2A_pc0117 [Agrobacterium genomosp. 2 str. CFBP 5494]|uniref:Uncharacterized protein n=1 Tax=Agrobacterium genomosp. 2 str. CFBP 5494 TaxID=1183436 RepID=A0A9W5B8E7_9HYPH|nr:hypothetical protein AKG12_23985 [Agrobacterium sp. SUL3]MDH1098865.1 hypothetical protein [Agrobacterium pusense]CUX04025.1 hypothetical protein AGR2A_pc0117 [Agrobacterium genomosp. 2 str. CFBP 5494]
MGFVSETCVIPADDPIGARFRKAVSSRKIIFMAGLPSSGKSLLFQQLTILAHEAGRKVHSMQWDAARRAFETGAWLDKYPEKDHITHPGVRKAVGIWVRRGIERWVKDHPEQRDILIGELPVVGGRFVELLQKNDDQAEQILTSQTALFFVPVPTREMRNVITSQRAITFANPRNEQETKDAPIHIVEGEWLAARQLHNRWQGVPDLIERDREYDPEIYRTVFDRLLRFRNCEILSVDRKFQSKGSAYDRPVEVTELIAGADEVKASYDMLERLYPGLAKEQAIDSWAEY